MMSLLLGCSKQGAQPNLLMLYTDEKIVYKPAIRAKQKIQIPTQLLSEGNNISMVYKLYEAKNSWKIYDVEIEDVSLLRSYRSQFDALLKTGTIDELLLELEKPIQQ